MRRISARFPPIKPCRYFLPLSLSLHNPKNPTASAASFKCALRLSSSPSSSWRAGSHLSSFFKITSNMNIASAPHLFASLIRFLVILCVACLGVCSASRGEGIEAVPQKQHLIFAHYMVCYMNDVSFCKYEIELAQRHGIDGFALNSGQWLGADGKPSQNMQAVERMYQAAKELNTGFKLFLSADSTGPARQTDNQCGMVRRFASHPNQMRQDGKPVFSAWAGRPETYGPAMEQLSKEGSPVFFVPFLSYPPYPANLSERRVRSYFDGFPFMDGFFYFAPDQTPAEMIQNNSTARRVTQELGKLYMAGVSPAYNSSNLRDYQGMKGYDSIWNGIIQDNADWVEIVTWNDYQEDSNLMPFRCSYPFLAEQFCVSRDESFLDVTAYYANWYKTGVRPKITQDKLYYVYRNRPKNLTKAWDHPQNRWIDVTKESGSQKSVDQIHDDVEDNLYVATFLTEPAELVISVGGLKQKFQQPAGIAYAALPLRAGVPHFTLLRGGKSVLDVDGRREIIGKATEDNSVNGAHLLNRTWSGGAVVGPVMQLEARTGKLEGNAVRKGNAVLIPTENGSGLKLSVSGLKTGTYNIRIVYRNPTNREARLTLISDGLSEEKSTPPHSIPLFLPPTGDGAKTTSFLWSLFDKTTELTVLCQIPEQKQGSTHPWAGDRGGVEIYSVQWVAVDAPAIEEHRSGTGLPEMVEIAGGHFKMGKEHGAPDEKPVRDITLSRFAIGKYEVTNEEYERCDLEHRKLRDAFSWRDCDPVIYLSWRQAARYCNWLSTHAELTPVYDEHSWKVDPMANGYRLPSEAQWEYVASGRGQDRTYPWGNETPTKERGNFFLHAALDIDQALIGSLRGSVMPVGSYEKGASRDGVMDMAGNVSEWCSDAYAPYARVVTSDPINEQGDRYKVIRGGSWGYYNYSQRVTDREFNTPVYPGFIYVGMRVALPQSGWNKVKNETLSRDAH